MDPSHLKRLKDEEVIAIQQTDEELKLWEKYRSDYVAVKDRMKTLPDKLSHDIMVPFGKLAFMPGKIVDTNRITVLLGDNWFAERSAKQACEMVDRRLEAVESNIKDLNAQRKLLKSRVEFTSDLGDVAQSKGGMVEITEEFDPEKEKQWREQHRKSVQRHRQQVAKSKQSDAATARTEDDIWSRLDELALQERLGHEIAKLDNEPTTSDTIPTTHADTDPNDTRPLLSKSVSWEDQKEGKPPESLELPDRSDETDSDDEEVDDYYDDDDEEESGDICKKITFRHSPREDEETNGAPVEDSSRDINSPRDIYKQFYKPTSILKTTTQTYERSEEDKPKDIKEKVIMPGSQAAFTGCVVERGTPDVQSTGSVESSKPKRVSKFKQRQEAKR